MDRTRNRYRSRRAVVRRSQSAFWPMAKWFGILFLVGAIVGGVIGLKQYQEFRADMPSLDKLNEQLDVSTRVIDRNGVLIGEIGTKRTVLKYSDFPPLLVDAVVAAEDQRFWTHGGVDFRGVGRAALSGVKHGFHFKQGASSIDQQVVKNYLGCSSTTRGLVCKIVEMFVAWDMEREYTKEEILTMYLNKISYGFDHYGIDSGARFIFGQAPKDLSLAKIALLAGLPQSPEKKSPFSKSTKPNEGRAGAIARQRYVLGRMLALDMISDADYDKAMAEKLVFVSERAPEANTGQEVLDYVRKFLIKKYGTMTRINRLGLTVQVSIDIKLQAAVKKALADGTMAIHARHPDHKEAPQGTVVVLDSASGEVLAMVGGAPYEAGGLNHAFAPRAPGSVMKLFVYAAAIESGKSIGLGYRDEQDCYEERGKPLWCPGNYSGEKAESPTVSLMTAFAHSFNTVAVKLMCGAPAADADAEETSVTVDEKGISHVLRPLSYCKAHGLIKPTIRIANELGVKSALDPEPSLVLGTSPVMPIEIAAAYAAIANGGRYVEPTIITKITGKDAPELPERVTRQALDPETAATMKQMLCAVVTQGTGRSADGRLTEQVCGKTGTAADFSDAWFAGFAGHITVVAQVGHNEAYGRNGVKLGARETGASAALPIFLDAASYALTGQPAGTVQRMSRKAVVEKVVEDPDEVVPQDTDSSDTGSANPPVQENAATQPDDRIGRNGEIAVPNNAAAVPNTEETVVLPPITDEDN
jgi:penicillin-binding protein 1A